LAPIRTTRRRTARFTVALSGAAFAVVALAAGAQAATTAAPAGPAAHVAAAAPAGGTVEGSAQPLTLAIKHHHHPKKKHHHRRHPRTPRQIGYRMLHLMHWNAKRQFPALDQLWNRESSWNVHAVNPYTGSTGIPQATPGDKMASAGPDWRNNAWTQIRWGLRYIRARYGSPQAAWSHELSDGWY
jgi:hypothetical protein